MLLQKCRRGVPMAITTLSLLTAQSIVLTPAVAARAAKNTDCADRVEMSVISLVQKEKGRLDLTVEYENVSNKDLRIAVYNGGANGKDTFLIDGSGEKWDFAKGGKRDVEKKVFLPGVKTKVKFVFDKVSGGDEVSSAIFVNWIHLLKPTGMSMGEKGFDKFCKLEVRDIPVAK